MVSYYSLSRNVEVLRTDQRINKQVHDPTTKRAKKCKFAYFDHLTRYLYIAKFT